jgi:hypothetical protein
MPVLACGGRTASRPLASSICEYAGHARTPERSPQGSYPLARSPLSPPGKRRRLAADGAPQRAVGVLLEGITRGGSIHATCQVARALVSDGYMSAQMQALASLGASGIHPGHEERDLHNWTKGLGNLHMTPYLVPMFLESREGMAVEMVPTLPPHELCNALAAARALVRSLLFGAAAGGACVQERSEAGAETAGQTAQHAKTSVIAGPPQT